jgi:hypothetical protein
LILVAAVLAPALLAVPGAGAQTSTTLTRQVIDPQEYPVARCNNGNAATFYFRPAARADRDKWVIHLDGAGSCNDAASCERRALGDPFSISALGLPATMTARGILSPDRSVNPDFAGYNHVFAHYCTSDLWVGDSQRRVGNAVWQFRGRPVFDAMIDQLARRSIGDAATLDTATEILLTGSSAGAIGVASHLDRVAVRFPKARVRGVADSGWVPVAVAPFTEAALGGLPWVTSPIDSVKLWNARPSGFCVDASDAASCLNLEVAFRHIRTPMFVYASENDPEALRLLGLTQPPGTDAEREYVGAFNRALRDSLAGVPAHYIADAPRRGILTDPAFNAAIAESGFVKALGDWYFERIEQGTTVPSAAANLR